MIDWHSHILPAVDDGSKSVTESLEMLKMMGVQGVDTVVATPHFFANDECVTAFADRCEKSYLMLEDAIEEAKKTSETLKIPQVILGAEVKYYNGISRLPELKSLAFKNRNLIYNKRNFNM